MDKDLEKFLKICADIFVKEEHGICTNEEWFAEFEDEYYYINKILKDYWKK